MKEAPPQITLHEVKRVLERCSADPVWRGRLKSEPGAAMNELGYDWDPKDIAPLWDKEASKEGPFSPTVMAFSEYVKSKFALRDMMRNQFPSHHPAYHKWRERQKARLLMHLGQARADSIVHAPMAIELNKGCSVGCWFCGVSAPKLSEIWAYNEANVSLWRSLLTTMGDILGPLARWGFCYWATDPLDNPDYEKFCSDFQEILGVFPQTTTALALRDPDRVRGLLKLSRERGCELNRFSILTLKQFLAVQQAYSAEELMNVECIAQNMEADLKKANAGKAHEKSEKKSSDGKSLVTDISGTIACVSGFLINMVEGSVRLITPCAADEKWPLGYWVLAEGHFTTAQELEAFVRPQLDGLVQRLDQLPRLRLAPYLDWNLTETGARVFSPYSAVDFTSPRKEYLKFMLSALKEGQNSAEELSLLAVYLHGVEQDQSLKFLENLLDLGLFDEEP